MDGLSMIGANAHTDREYAEVDSMVPRLYLLTRMVMELGRKP
jgi:glutamate carboxypeptidase